MPIKYPLCNMNCVRVLCNLDEFCGVFFCETYHSRNADGPEARRFRLLSDKMNTVIYPFKYPTRKLPSVVTFNAYGA